MTSVPRFLLLTLLVAIPQSAFAGTTLQQILNTIGGLINQATPIVVAAALFAFFWGLAMYLFGAGTGSSGSSAHSMFGAPSTASKRDGRTMMVMGVIVLFVMFSIWGLVNIIQNTFGLTGNQQITPPTITNPYR